MRFIICISIFLLTTVAVNAQLSCEDVKEILIIQGETTNNLDKEAEVLHQKYLDRISYHEQDLIDGIYTGVISGVCMGAHQSRTANYLHSNWLPGFVEDWWTIKPQTNMAFGKVASWQKVFREADYIYSIKEYNNLNRYFGDKWYYTIPASAFIKNLSASLIRHKFKYGRFF